MLSIKNLQQKHLNWKLSHKFIEPFWVEDLIRKQIYWIFLLTVYCIHNIFYVLYLKSYIWYLSDESVLSLQSLKLIDNKEKYEIEKILDKRKHKKKILYKVK